LEFTLVVVVAQHPKPDAEPDLKRALDGDVDW